MQFYKSYEGKAKGERDIFNRCLKEEMLRNECTVYLKLINSLQRFDNNWHAPLIHLKREGAKNKKVRGSCV